MSFQRGTPLTLTTGAVALTRGRFVKLVAGLVVVSDDGTDEDVIGVTSDDSEIGAEIGVHMIDGMSIVEVEAGAAIAIGVQVSAVDAVGRAGLAAASDVPSGIALNAVSGVGEFVTVLLTRLGAAT